MKGKELQRFIDGLVEAERQAQENLAHTMELYSVKAWKLSHEDKDTWLELIVRETEVLREKSRQIAFLKESLISAVTNGKMFQLPDGTLYPQLSDLANEFMKATGQKLPAFTDTAIGVEKIVLPKEALSKWQEKLTLLLDVDITAILSKVVALEAEAAGGKLTKALFEAAMTELLLEASKRAVKFVNAGGRNVTENIVKKNPHKFAYGRHAEPGACGFCLMLVSRGAVYSADTVLKTATKTHKGHSFNSYHYHCRCSAYTIPRGKGIKTSQTKFFEQQWKKHVKDKKKFQKDARKVFDEIAKDLDWNKVP